MNKKYFAKYLPVKGEIKEGDWYLDEGEPMEAIDDRPLNARPYDLWEGYQKVKLFLCSRDIQVGNQLTDSRTGQTYQISDEYMHGGIPCWLTEHEKTIDGSIYGGDSYTLFKKEYAFKVIGEISPDASWVKEGDEFDEDDVHIPDSFHWNKDDSGLLIGVKVRGLCGHFH